jgi:hypothetical protein
MMILETRIGSQGVEGRLDAEFGQGEFTFGISAVERGDCFVRGIEARIQDSDAIVVRVRLGWIFFVLRKIEKSFPVTAGTVSRKRGFQLVLLPEREFRVFSSQHARFCLFVDGIGISLQIGVEVSEPHVVEDEVRIDRLFPIPRGIRRSAAPTDMCGPRKIEWELTAGRAQWPSASRR